MNIETIPVGFLQTNCYIVDDGKYAAVIDPGDDAKKLLDYIEKKGLICERILLTHGHYDHIGAVFALKQKTGAKVLINEKDKISLRFEPDETVSDGDVIKAGQLEFACMETPGHSEGSVCYICGDCLFSGDTLFLESVGRTDLPGGDFETLRHSLEKINALPEEDMRVFPGHAAPTTLAHERRCNMFMRIV
ncbi:MAG: MBL fold metallo-hydrolase [Oscillospiraceae bacterium]